MSVNLGYACINTTLRKEGIFSSRTLILKTLRKKGRKEAMRLARLNIEDMKKIIEWNEAHGIRVFRMTSNLFPHMGSALIMNDREFDEVYNLDFARDLLADVGKLARGFGHRLTFHPGQFAQLGSPRPEVVEQTFRDLNLHAAILCAMGLSTRLGSVMIIHGGGVYGDKEATLARWAANFARLPTTTREFVSLENDDVSYAIDDLLPLCERLDIPLTIDFFHHQCNPGPQGADRVFDDDLLDRVIAVWRRRGIKPKCHVSSQRKNGRKGNHDDYIDADAIGFARILAVCVKYSMDIVLECKQKDLCLIRLRDEFFERNVRADGAEYWLVQSK